MKLIKILAEKIYWFFVFAVSLLPAYAYGEYPAVRTCNVDEICFRTGGAILNREAELIIYFIVLVLWPICAWNIFGKHLISWRPRLNSEGGSIIKIFTFSCRVFYWGIVAAIPMLFRYMFATFLAPHDCNLNWSCFQFYMPLTTESNVAVLIACCVLWPLCAWNIAKGLRSHKT